MARLRNKRWTNKWWTNKWCTLSKILDLERYLRRIGYRGVGQPSPDVLIALHQAHVGSIPFENVDVLLQKPIALEVAAIEDKLVARNRGGYCYEHALLFQAALEALDFETRPLLARVRWPNGREGPRTHMMLCVATENGDYLADVGFGGRGLLRPLPLTVNRVHETPDARYRLTAESAGLLLLEGNLGADWQAHYAFTVAAAHPKDIEMANYYVSTYPTSLFRQMLLVHRIRPGRRAVLANRKMTIVTSDGVTSWDVQDAAALQDVLYLEFGLELAADDLREIGPIVFASEG